MLRRLAEMGNAAAEDRLGQIAAPRDAQPAIASKRSLAFLGYVHVIVGRIVDDAGDDLPFALERNRDREQRDRVQEVGGRIERIDVPSVTLVGPLDASALLQDEAIARTRLGELIIEGLLRALVGRSPCAVPALQRGLSRRIGRIDCAGGAVPRSYAPGGAAR